MALAVLGGSFDPVHRGHVAMARFVLVRGLAKEVLVVPAARSPFKGKSVATDGQRLAMARLAFADCPACVVDDLEIRRGEPSYMIDTLEEIQQRDPDRHLRLLVGGDNLAGFFSWRRAADILALAQVVVLGRQGYDLAAQAGHEDSFLLQPEFDRQVSSTTVRAMLAAGEPVAGLLPEAVARFIQKNGLYR